MRMIQAPTSAIVRGAKTASDHLPAAASRIWNEGRGRLWASRIRREPRAALLLHVSGSKDFLEPLKRCCAELPCVATKQT
jgi:hypothetical protein